MLKSTAREPQVLVKELALLAGFDLVGIARIEDLGEDKGRVVEWISAGRHGTMG